MRLLPIAACALLLGGALAQTAAGPWTVGVVVSATGPYADVGRPQAFAAERAAAYHALGGVFGTPLVVELRDDGGDPRKAEALAVELAEGGAHAVVCCTLPAATTRVAAALDVLATPHLALADVDLAGRFWSFGLVPDDRARLTAAAVDAAGQAKASLALMTLDSAFGDATVEAFERASADAGRAVAGSARYPADAPVLTPEALWIATRQPGAVVVWGLPRDLPVALDGLRRRGYEGIVYVREEALPGAVRDRLLPAGDHVLDHADPWSGVRVAVAPAAIADRLPAGHPHADAVQAFVGRALGGDPHAASPAERVVMARVDDALLWLHAAFEQVAALGLPTPTAATLRLATRDALVSAPAARLAAGTYDAVDGETRVARWQGLVVAVVGPFGR